MLSKAFRVEFPGQTKYYCDLYYSIGWVNATEQKLSESILRSGFRLIFFTISFHEIVSSSAYYWIVIGIWLNRNNTFPVFKIKLVTIQLKYWHKSNIIYLFYLSRYESITEQVTVPEEGSVSVNFTLMADDPQHWSSAYDFRWVQKPTLHGAHRTHIALSCYTLFWPIRGHWSTTSRVCENQPCTVHTGHVLLCLVFSYAFLNALTPCFICFLILSK